MASINKCEDDIISYCGSLSGETFSSRRKKNTCTLRQHSIDVLAAKLRDHSFDIEKQDDASHTRNGKPRCNTFFHHYRFIVAIFGGFSLGSMLLLRYNITVAILNMVNQTALYMEEHPDKTIDDFIAEGYSLGGEFDWDNEIQHMVMSWYMVAYTLPQMPCTKLGIMLGSRLATPISLFICAVSTLLTPMFSYWGWQWVIALRLINGLGAAAVLPMMLNLIENWMPYEEISLGLTCATILQCTLTAANPLLAGYLSSIHWSYAFYVPGSVTIVFCILWIILIADRPDESWVISQKELDLICGCSKVDDHSNHRHSHGPAGTKQVDNNNCCGNNNNAQKLDGPKEADDRHPSVSLLQVFRVRSFYAFLFIWCFYCSSYSCFTFILPTYLRQFLKIGVSTNGFYCFIIQSGCLLSALWPHPFLRVLQTKFNLSVTASRRITHAVIGIMVASTWIYVGLFHETQLFFLFINRCFQGSNDIVVTGCLMSNYAKAGLSSIVFSMVNTVGNLSVVFSSTFIGYLLDYTGQSREGWTWIFSGLGVSQLVILAVFSTIIRSGPIEFKKKDDNNNEKYSNTTTPANNQQMGADIESAESVAANKKDGTISNNFDKLRAGRMDSIELNMRDHDTER